MQELGVAWADFAANDADVLKLIAGPPKISDTGKRINWRAKGADGAAITIRIEPKKNGTASVVAQLTGQPTPEASDAARSAWSEIVTRFVASLDS